VKLLRAIIKPLTASISKWLVGSSIINIYGLFHTAIANDILLFYPPDNKYYGLNYKLPLNPNDDKCDLYDSVA